MDVSVLPPETEVVEVHVDPETYSYVLIVCSEKGKTNPPFLVKNVKVEKRVEKTENMANQKKNCFIEKLFRNKINLFHFCDNLTANHMCHS